MAYRQMQKKRGNIIWRAAASLRFYTRALKRLVGTARRGAQINDGKNFSATQASMFVQTAVGLVILVRRECATHEGVRSRAPASELPAFARRRRVDQPPAMEFPQAQRRHARVTLRTLGPSP